MRQNQPGRERQSLCVFNDWLKTIIPLPHGVDQRRYLGDGGQSG